MARGLYGRYWLGAGQLHVQNAWGPPPPCPPVMYGRLIRSAAAEDKLDLPSPAGLRSGAACPEGLAHIR